MNGRLCIIRENDHVVMASVVDSIGKRPKRVRIQTGEHAGEVRMRGQYKFIEYCEPHEAPSMIAATWAETWME